MVKLLGGRAASAVIGFFMLAIGSSANAQDVAGSAASLVQPAVVLTQAPAAASVTVKVPTAMATEAAWLYKGGWGLAALVDKFATSAQLDEQTNCLATAVYFEARGETAEGQLAVARVVMNRAVSGRYPTDWCSVVKQPAQFSFVRHGEFPYADTSSLAWQRAEAVAQLAVANVVPSVSNDVLWYHADYVAPSWGRRLAMVEKIGAHIFYRA
ncbi:MAG: cell wall hydrolase [Sphingomonas sp.]|nr:cell wall hydrolase [Sphingomonas sp.]